VKDRRLPVPDAFIVKGRDLVQIVEDVERELSAAEGALHRARAAFTRLQSFVALERLKIEQEGGE